jgi:hypothetical protein
MLPFIRYQMSAHTAPIQTPGVLLIVFKAITWRMKEYLLPLSWDVSLEVRSWALRFCYLAAIIILFRNRRNLSRDMIAMWAISLVITLSFLVVARLSGETLLQARHTVALFVPLNLAVFAIVTLANNKKVLICWVTLVLIFSFTGLYAHNGTLAKPGDWKRVGAHLMASEKVDQPILVFHAGAALPLEHYYAGINSLVPVPRDNAFERFDFHDYVLRDEREIIEALKRIPGGHEQIWAVTDWECGFADLSYHCELFEEFLNKYYTVIETRNFRNSTVRLLQRKKEF